MSTRTSTATPARGKPAGVRTGRRWLRLRDARIRSKLGLLLVVPILAIAVLAIARLVESGQQASSAQLVSSLASLSSDVAGATNELQQERMFAAKYLGTPQPIAGNQASQTAYTQAQNALKQQIKNSDQAIQTYRTHRAELGDLPTNVAERLRSIDQEIGTVGGVRQVVQSRQGTSISEVVLRYGVVIDSMVAYHGELSQLTTNTRLSDSLRAMAAFVDAKAQAAQEQSVAYSALYSASRSGTLDAAQYNVFVGTLTAQQSALATFQLTANAGQRALVDQAISGDAVQLASQVAQSMGRSIGSANPVISADEAATSLAGELASMRWAEQQLDAQLVSDAKAVQSSVIRQVVIESIAVVITLMLAIGLAFLLARTMARSLSRLREGALGVANRDLPEAVSRLRDIRDIGENSPEEIARQVRDPIQIDSRDEIGQVAQAFNVVHREAVRVAAEQAALRTSVSAMFLNLARRSQALVDRIIGELDSIERGEEDPKRLARLFQLDHLATRMRRNDENLLVLAGADSSPPRRDNALLADVARAAQSEVEQYNRIEFGTLDQDVSVTAHAVNDIVRLLAELFDNATRFSPPNSTVLVDGRRIGDYVLVQIEDRGLGMSAEQMGALNQRLAEPPSVDVASFRMMGLAVVARLASRYGIKVELRPNPDSGPATSGTVTSVTLPSTILVLPRLRGREPVIARPRQPLAVESGHPAATAPNAGNSVNPPGWPMPQLPGLVAPAPTAPANSGQGAVPAATMNGSWETSVDGRREWRPAVDALGYTMGSSQPPVVGDDTTELPIFRAMDAVWFRSHGHSATEDVPNGFHQQPGNGGQGVPGQPMSSMPSAAAGMSQPTAPQMQVPPPASPYGGGSPAYPQQPTGPSFGAPSYAAPPPAAPSYAAPPPPAPQPAAVPPPAMPPPAVPPLSAPLGSPLPRRPQAAPQPASPGTAQPYVPAAASPPPVPPPPPPGTVPPSRDEVWRTAADDGWRAAAAAAAPTVAGTTRSGLPKRVPAAQLVPGGVETPVAASRTRRTPDEVRGLLSAYHRGVQRGRANSSEAHMAGMPRPGTEETNR